MGKGERGHIPRWSLEPFVFNSVFLCKGGQGGCCLDRMGARLSAPQEEVFDQVAAALGRGGMKFSRDLLRRFVKWLFSHFPDMSPKDVKTVMFWDAVVTELMNLTKRGDASGDKFYPLFVKILFVVENQETEKERGKVGKQPSQFPPVLPKARLSQSPCSNPLSTKSGRLEGGTRRNTKAQSCYQLSGSSQPPLSSKAPAAGDPSPDPQSSLSPPVENPQVVPQSSLYPTSQDNSQRAQDGGGHMAGPPSYAFSPPNPVLPASSHPSGSSTSLPSAFQAAPAAPPMVPPPVSSPGTFPLGSTPIPVPCPGSSAHPLPTSGSQAPTSGSQNVGAGCDGLGNWNPDQKGLIFAPPFVCHRRGEYPPWRPFKYQNIRELCRDQEEFGRESHYFKGLLKAALSSYVLLPSDLKELFSCLLSPAEYLLWEVTWKGLLKDLLPGLIQDPDCKFDAQGGSITLDHLCGEGNWAQAGKQAELIPQSVLERIKGAAEKALRVMPPRYPQPSYLDIEQSPSEPFLDFIDRLYAAVEKWFEEEEIHENIVLSIARARANEACKDVFLRLLWSPRPTLGRVIEACTKQALLDNSAPRRDPEQREREGTPAPAVEGRVKCSQCGQEGHVKRFCHFKTKNTKYTYGEGRGRRKPDQKN